MDRWIQININDKVRFRFANGGELIWRKYWEPYSGGRDPLQYIPADAEGWREEQLWMIMSVLGPHLHNGIDNPLDTVLEIRAR